MLKYLILFLANSGLTACGPKNDPRYLALKANPPTQIPAKHLPKLRRGIVSCDVYDEGKASQYMTCWWPANGSVPPVAALTYYGGGLRRPHPDNIIAPGGEPITDFLPLQ